MRTDRVRRHPSLPQGFDIAPARLVTEEDGVRILLRKDAQEVIAALTEHEALAVASALVDEVMRIRGSRR